MPRCWLQALGGCLGTVVAPRVLNSLVSPAIAAAQLCGLGSTQDCSTFSKTSRRPWKPPGVGRWGTGVGGSAVISIVPHTLRCSSLGRWEWGIVAGRAHQPSPRGLLSVTWGARSSPTRASGIPLLPTAPMLPLPLSLRLSHSAGALPPPLILPVPRLSLPRVFLRVSCPLFSPEGINHPPAPALALRGSSRPRCHLPPMGPGCLQDAGNLFPDQRGFIQERCRGLVALDPLGSWGPTVPPPPCALPCSHPDTLSKRWVLRRGLQRGGRVGLGAWLY